MKNFLFIILGIFIGLGITVFACNFTQNTSENLQIEEVKKECKECNWENITDWSASVERNSDDISQIQIWCDLLGITNEQRENYCIWYYELNRWKLTCKGLERLFGKNIKGNEYGNYKCYD